MGSWFLREDAVGNSVKGLTKVQVDNIHSLSLIHYTGQLVTEGDQVGQAGPAFHMFAKLNAFWKTVTSWVSVAKG